MAKATTKKVSTNKVSNAKKKDLLDPKAYQLLKEYINNISNTNSLNDFVQKEIVNIKETLSKFINIPWAVSGRKYAKPDSSSTGPR